MRVWLINSIEPTPADAGDAPLRRMGRLTQQLLRREHEVDWFSSTFSHSKKLHRYRRDAFIEISEQLRVRYLHVPAYHKNISLSRLRNQYLLGRKLRATMAREEEPDLILCSYPTLEMSFEAVRYGRSHHVPVVLDIGSQWPDSFLGCVPNWSKSLARTALSPYFRMSQRACTGATSLCATSRELLDWALQRGRRQATALDRAFPIGHSDLEIAIYLELLGGEEAVEQETLRLAA